MKARTRFFSTLLAVLMVFAVCPIFPVSAQEATLAQSEPVSYWQGVEAIPGTTDVAASASSVMDFVLANTEYKATVTDLEGHLEIDESAKEIRILDETGFAIFVILTNNAYTIYEADGETVKFDGQRTTAPWGISTLFGDKVITLEKDLYLNDPTKPVAEWNNFAPMFLRGIAGAEDETGNLNFDGRGHSIVGWYAKGTVSEAAGSNQVAFGLFGVITVAHNYSIRNLAMLYAELDVTIDASVSYTMPVGGLIGCNRFVGTTSAVNPTPNFGDVTIENVIVDVSIRTNDARPGSPSRAWWIVGTPVISGWDFNKSTAIGGLCGGFQRLPFNTQNNTSLCGAFRLSNLLIKAEVVDQSSQRAVVGGITSELPASPASATIENVMVLNNASGFTGSGEGAYATAPAWSISADKVTAKNVWANGELHAHFATAGTGLRSNLILSDLYPYAMRKAQSAGEFTAWDLEGGLAVPTLFAAKATQIKTAFEGITYWDGTVPGLIAGDTYTTSYAETDNILAEGESVLDFIVANKPYNISKAQFDAHITLGAEKSDESGRYYNITINDEIGLAIWAIFTSSDSKIINADGSVFYSSSVQGTAGYTANGAYRMLAQDDGCFVRLARNLYLNDPAKPKSEWKEMAPLYWRLPKSPSSVNARVSFDGKNYTVQGWYVDHTLTEKDTALNAYGFLGNLISAYYTNSVKNIAIVDSYLNLTVSNTFKPQNDCLRVGGLVGRIYIDPYQGWGYGDKNGVEFNTVAVDTKITVTVEDPTIYQNNQAGLWLGRNDNEAGTLSHNGHTKAVVVGGLFGGMYTKRTMSDINHLTVKDALINVKVDVTKGEQTVAMTGLFPNCLFKKLVLQNTVIYSDFAQTSGEGFAVDTFNNMKPVTGSDIQHVVVNGAKHYSMTDPTCRTVASFDLFSEIFAGAKGEGFANWDTSGQVPVPSAFRATAPFFANTIALRDSEFLKVLGVSIRATDDPAKQGLRLAVEVNTKTASIYSPGYTLRYGTLFIPTADWDTDTLMQITTPGVMNIWENIALLDATTEGTTPSMWTFAEAKQYNVALVNFPHSIASTAKEACATSLTMRSYISVVDGEGNTVITVYSETVTASVLSVAEKALLNENLDADHRAQLTLFVAEMKQQG